MIVTRALNLRKKFTVSNITIRHFSGLQGLGVLRNDWIAVTQSLSPHRFIHLYEWFRAYLDTLESDKDSVHFFALYRNGSAVGIFPLKYATRRVRGIQIRQWELPQHPHMNLCDAIFARTQENVSLLAVLCAYLKNQRDLPWDVLTLQQTLEDSAVAFSLNAAPPPRLVSTSIGYSRYVTSDESPDAINVRLSGSFKRNLRRLARRAEETGKLEYRSYCTLEKLLEAFPFFLEVEASGWKGAQGKNSAISLHARSRAFYTQLIENCSPDGRCAINLLWLNDVCIAGQLGLLVDRVFYILKIGYHDSYAQLAPGNLLMERVLDDCSQNGVMHTVSFVTDAPWSHLWNPQAYVVSTHNIFNSSGRGWASYLALLGVRRVRSLMKILQHHQTDKAKVSK